jgi:excisionase family DNA binding protein
MNTKSVHITTRQVADRFGVNIATVRRWVNAGLVMPDVTTPGGHHRFSEENVAALVEAHSGVRAERPTQASSA